MKKKNRTLAMHRSASLTSLALLGLVSIYGCGGYPGGAVPVTGVVTLNGARLEQGTVCFHDADGMTVAIGMVDGGSYAMSRSESHKGVMPGSYQVSLMSWIEFPGMTLPNGSTSKGLSRVPKKFIDPKTSGLSAEVGDRGATLDFAVEGEPESVEPERPKKAGRAKGA